MTDVNIALWKEIEATISKFGSASRAKELRHNYMNNSISDELFEGVWAIFAAELRKNLEKVYIKYEVDPNEIKKERASNARGATIPKPLKANDFSKTKGLKFEKIEGGL